MPRYCLSRMNTSNQSRCIVGTRSLALSRICGLFPCCKLLIVATLLCCCLTTAAQSDEVDVPVNQFAAPHVRDWLLLGPVPESDRLEDPWRWLSSRVGCLVAMSQRHTCCSGTCSGYMRLESKVASPIAIGNPRGFAVWAFKIQITESAVQPIACRFSVVGQFYVVQPVAECFQNHNCTQHRQRKTQDGRQSGPAE